MSTTASRRNVCTSAGPQLSEYTADVDQVRVLHFVTTLRTVVVAAYTVHQVGGRSRWAGSDVHSESPELQVTVHRQTLTDRGVSPLGGIGRTRLPRRASLIWGDS